MWPDYFGGDQYDSSGSPQERAKREESRKELERLHKLSKQWCAKCEVTQWEVTQPTDRYSLPKAAWHVCSLDDKSKDWLDVIKELK
jgi:hypothetical protein